MLVYRVFPYDPTASPGASGHPDYLYRPAQGLLRLDNPHHYLTGYYGATPEVAVGESFADLAKWSEEMFETPFLPNGRKVLGVYEIPDDAALLELDDANNLAERALRPTQIVSRVRPQTQAWALRVFQERRQHDNERKWHGVRWWSYHRPHWTVFGLWTGHSDPAPHRLVAIEELSAANPAVKAAQHALKKPWH